MSQHKKNIKYRIAAAVTTIAVLVIVAVINLFAQLFPLKLDFSTGRLYSVGETTKSVIKNIDKEVIIYGLFDDGKLSTEYKEIKALLEKYKMLAKGRINIKYVDPDRDTKIIKKLDPEGTLELKKDDFLIVSGGKSKKLTYEELFKMEFDNKTSTWFTTGSLAEQAFTGAIHFTASDNTPIIYFSEGQESSVLESEYTSLLEAVKKNGYLIKKLDLNQEEAVPKDAGVVIWLSPKEDLTSVEAQKLKSYLENGGSAAFLVDALKENPDLSQFNAVVKDYGLKLNHDKIEEEAEDKHTPQDKHHLLLDVSQNDVIPLEFYGMVFPDSRSIAVESNKPEDLGITILAQTSDSAVGRDFTDSKESNAEGLHTKGLHTIAAAAKKDLGSAQAKVLLIGNGFFLSDAVKKDYTPYYGNGIYFFLSTLDWLSDKGQDVVVAPKEYIRGELQIPKLKAEFIGFLVIIVLPGAIFGYGISRWNKRRYL